MHLVVVAAETIDVGTAVPLANQLLSHCPAGLSILLATFTPLSPFTYFAIPR